jgi:hypothetical protein
MKTSILSFVFAAITSLACANSNDFSSVLRQTEKFNGLIVNSNANVILSQGEESSVRIEGDQNTVGQVNTEVNHGALVISGQNSKPVTIYITVEEINLIEINGSAKIYANTLINSDIILLKVNGSGSIKADIRALTVGMIVKGSGKIIASGSTGESYSRVYGTGSVYASSLDAFSSSEMKITSNNDKRARLSLHQ